MLGSAALSLLPCFLRSLSRPLPQAPSDLGDLDTTCGNLNLSVRRGEVCVYPLKPHLSTIAARDTAASPVNPYLTIHRVTADDST